MKEEEKIQRKWRVKFITIKIKGLCRSCVNIILYPYYQGLKFKTSVGSEPFAWSYLRHIHRSKPAQALHSTMEEVKQIAEQDVQSNRKFTTDIFSKDSSTYYNIKKKTWNVRLS